MSGLGINPGLQSQIAVASLFVEQIVPGPQGLGSQGSGRMHPVIVSGLGINPGWQSQTAIAPLFIKQIVPGPQGPGLHGSVMNGVEFGLFKKISHQILNFN